jgi:hypothetical protein
MYNGLDFLIHRSRKSQKLHGCKGMAVHCRHSRPHSTHCEPLVEGAFGGRTTLRNMVIGSSALRIWYIWKLALCELHFGFGHCSVDRQSKRTIKCDGWHTFRHIGIFPRVRAADDVLDLLALESFALAPLLVSDDVLIGARSAFEPIAVHSIALGLADRDLGDLETVRTDWTD